MKNDEDRTFIYKVYIIGLSALKASGNKENKISLKKGIDLIPDVVNMLVGDAKKMPMKHN